MDRSNTRNMRGGKARFVQRRPLDSLKSPRVKHCKFDAKPSESRNAITSHRALDAKKEDKS